MKGPLSLRAVFVRGIFASLFLAGSAFSQSPDSLIVTDVIAPPGDTAVVSVLLHNTQYPVGGFTARLVLADSINASFQRAERGEDIADFDYFNVRISDGVCRLVGIADLPAGGSPPPISLGLHQIATVFIFVEETAPWGLTDSMFFRDDSLPPDRDNSISDSTGYINEVPTLVGGEITFDLHVGVDDRDNLPDAIELHQNFPNPFNIETTIRFDLPEPAEAVSLSIYDMMGRRLRRLSLGNLAAGRYDIAWNGRDDDGLIAASGIYFYRLSIGSSFVETRRMTLLK